MARFYNQTTVCILSGCFHRRLHTRVNAYTTAANRCASDRCRANEFTANRRTDRRAADAPRATCCFAKPTPNRRRNTYADKPTGNQ